jgi:hypothetical protein
MLGAREDDPAASEHARSLLRGVRGHPPVAVPCVSR